MLAKDKPRLRFELLQGRYGQRDQEFMELHLKRPDNYRMWAIQEHLIDHDPLTIEITQKILYKKMIWAATHSQHLVGMFNKYAKT